MENLEEIKRLVKDTEQKEGVKAMSKGILDFYYSFLQNGADKETAKKLSVELFVKLMQS